MGRVLFHDKIDKEQRNADLADGAYDTLIGPPEDSFKTVVFTRTLIYDVDNIQIQIENMPANGRDAFGENQQKIRYLRAVWEMMRSYNTDPHPDTEYYKGLVDNLDSMMVSINEHRLDAFVDSNVNIFTLNNCKELFDNPSKARSAIYGRMGELDPIMMVKRLGEFSKDTVAQNVIAAAAKLDPNLIFSYAMSSNFQLKNAVLRTKDTLVQAIVTIATKSKAPLKTFPFLSDIYHNRKTIAELDTIADHSDLYFSNLVRLKMENDTLGRYSYNNEISYRALKNFIREMNERHEDKDDIRFKCIDSMSPTAMYYIMVYGQDEIYTSTFLGTFKRMMERMKPMKGNQLLDTLHFDHFRTFIRMCAGYNTLSDFLGSIDDTARLNLMTRFIGGLEIGSDDELEDAVDVADAFGSIRDSALASFLQKKVTEDYEISYKKRSRKGMIVYSLLAKLFEGNKISTTDTGASVTSSRLKLPPINRVAYKDLIDDSGTVYQQVFFFGDKDGKDSYDSYIYQFKNDDKWQITNEKYWTVISSVRGKKTVIYANLPIDEPGDEEAQDTLTAFLNDSGIHPSIMIHRGHSYHLKATLSKLNKSVKVVILGSCGGYHNLALVLDKAPDAHIISSKQTGAMAVNEPIIRAVNSRLLTGEDINWMVIWHELDDYFAKRPEAQDKFSDYVPPYKNLGAIFIKAYRRVMKS